MSFEYRFFEKQYKTYCKQTTLKVYHKYPKLRLYIPYDISEYLLRQKGRFRNIYINDIDITNYAYVITERKTHRKRFIINAYATQKYNLNTTTLYNICVKKEILPLQLYRYEFYFSYEETEEESEWQRKFNVSFYTPITLDYSEIISAINDAILDSLGSDYLDIVIGIRQGVAIARYLGYETIKAIEFELNDKTKVSFPYIVIDLQHHYPPYNWGNFTIQTNRKLLSYKSKIITLDYDRVDLNFVYQQLKKLLNMNIKDNIKRIELYSTTHGYHVYIYLHKGIKFKEQIDIRKKLQDDPKRIEIDEYKYNIATTINYYSLPAINTLFRRKWQIVKGTPIEISSETFIRIINVDELGKI